MVTQLDAPISKLIVTEHYNSMTPQMLFRCWTEPLLLQQWWPKVAHVEPHLGGNYHFSWPSIEQDLRGQYLIFDPGVALAFTWRWDSELPTATTRDVSIHFEPDGNGTRLTLTHGPYVDTPEDQVVRIEHHLAGWVHFLPQLHNVEI